MSDKINTNIEKIESTQGNIDMPEISNKEKLNEELNSKVLEWRRIGKFLDKEKSDEIETIIIGLQKEMDGLLSDTSIELDEKSYLEMLTELNDISTNLDAKIVENKDTILNETKDKYEENKETFNKNLEEVKETLQKNLLEALPQNDLNKVIGKNVTVKDLILKEINMGLANLGAEVRNIPGLISETENLTDTKKILDNLELLNSSSQTLTLGPKEYLSGLYNWNENAEISSAIVSNLNEYILALNFFYSGKSIEEKIGIKIPKNRDYKETNTLIQKRETILLDRFRGENGFAKEYKALSPKDIVRLKEDYESDILTNFIAETLKKDGSKTSLKDVKEAMDFFEKDKTFKSEKSSDENDYQKMQLRVLDEIASNSTLKDVIRFNIVAEASGDKLSEKTDKSWYATCSILKELNYLDDPRLLKYQHIIDEIAEIGEVNLVSEKQASEMRKDLWKNHKEEIRAPEGLGNLLYATRRLFNSFGENFTEREGADGKGRVKYVGKLMEYKNKGLLTFDLINHDRTKKGSKNKEGRTFLMTKKTFEERKKINANKMAFTNGKTFENKKGDYITYQSTGSTTEKDYDDISKDEGTVKTIINKINEYIPKNPIRKLFKKETQAVTVETAIPLIINSELTEEQAEILKPQINEITEKIPDKIEINEKTIANLEKINGENLSVETQKILAKKTIEDKTLENYTLNKKQELSNDIKAKYLIEAFNPLAVNNIDFFQNYKAEEVVIKDENSAEKTKLDIPTMENPESLNFMSKNIERIKNPTTIGILNLYLNKDLRIDSKPEEKEIYKTCFEAVYKDNILNPDEYSIDRFNKYQLAKQSKNILLFSDRDIQMLESGSEKNPVFIGKLIQNWIKNYGFNDINKDLAKEGLKLASDEIREKSIKILTILEKISTPETNILKANIKKTINEAMGLNETFEEDINSLAEIALGTTPAENDKQWQIAIESFTSGIFKDKNPKNYEISDKEFFEKINKNLIAVNSRLLGKSLNA